MQYTATGRIAVLKPTQVVSEKFSKREFVIETEGQYPQLIPMEFHQDKCQLLNLFKEGDFVTVSFNIRGRKWEDKYFVNLQAWQISANQTDVQQPQPETFSTGSGLPF